jgi:AcrR family transcriptional regulator
MANERYSLQALAQAAGVSKHTIRHYVRRRLLPTAVREGAAAWFRDEHLARMRLIGQLRREGHRGPELVARLSAAVARAVPPPPPKKGPTTRHAVDSAVCAAAEALDISPRGLRVALAAVFRTLDDANVTLADAARLVTNGASG